MNKAMLDYVRYLYIALIHGTDSHKVFYNNYYKLLWKMFKSFKISIIYTTQVNSTFHAFRLPSSEANSKCYSHLSKQRKTGTQKTKIQLLESHSIVTIEDFFSGATAAQNEHLEKQQADFFQDYPNKIRFKLAYLCPSMLLFPFLEFRLCGFKWLLQCFILLFGHFGSHEITCTS